MYSLALPDHWLRDFFYAEGSVELRLVQDALSYYNNLSLVGFSSSPYITAQMAIANFHLKSQSMMIQICRKWVWPCCKVAVTYLL